MENGLKVFNHFWENWRGSQEYTIAHNKYQQMSTKTIDHCTVHTTQNMCRVHLYNAMTSCLKLVTPPPTQTIGNNNGHHCTVYTTQNICVVFTMQ